MESFETLPFLRGISNIVSHPFVAPIRKDRRPRDLEFELHEAADDWFLKRFGVRFRSQSLFVTSLHVVASGYGPQTVRILPLGDYRYCWSRTTSDLISILKGAAVGQVQGLLDAAQYVDVDLAAAHRAGHEVMLYCDEYIAIPFKSVPGPVSVASVSSGKMILI